MAQIDLGKRMLELAARCIGLEREVFSISLGFEDGFKARMAAERFRSGAES